MREVVVVISFVVVEGNVAMRWWILWQCVVVMVVAAVHLIAFANCDCSDFYESASYFLCDVIEL